MNPTIQYHVISSSSIERLEKIVIGFLEAGWELHGHCVPFYDNTYDCTMYTQTIIKKG